MAEEKDAKVIAKELREQARELEADARRLKGEASKLKSAAHVLDPRGAKPGAKRKRKQPKIETEPKPTITEEEVLAVLQNGSATMSTILRDLDRDDPVAYDEVRVILSRLVVRNVAEKYDGFYSLVAGEVTT